MGSDPVGLDPGRGRLPRPPAAAHAGTGAVGDGAGQCRLPAVCAADIQPLRPVAALAARRGRRAQSAAAGHRAGIASAHSVHGLCWLFGGLCAGHCRPAGRQGRCRLGTLEPALDAGRLAVSHSGHSPGQLVGLLRTGLGWLVVLGSCGKCFLHALAAGHSAAACPGGDGAKRRAHRLDTAAGHRDLLTESAGHFPGPLGCADIGACLCLGSGPGAVYPAVPHGGGR